MGGKWRVKRGGEGEGRAGARCTPCTRLFSRPMCYYQYTMICTPTSVSLLQVGVGYSLTKTILLKARQWKMETVDGHWRAVGRLNSMRRIPQSAPASNHWVCSSSPHGTSGLEYYIPPGNPQFARPERGIGSALWPYRHHTSIYEYCTRNSIGWFKLNDRNSFPAQVHAVFSSQTVIFCTSFMSPFEDLTQRFFFIFKHDFSSAIVYGKFEPP